MLTIAFDKRAMRPALLAGVLALAAACRSGLEGPAVEPEVTRSEVPSRPVERASAPAVESVTPPAPDPLEACADGDDEACLAIHEAQAPITTSELAAQVVAEMVGGDWDVPLGPEHRASFQDACRTGDGRACAFLAYQTRRGLGVASDDAAALRWFRLACAQRYWFACNDLTMSGDPLGEAISRRSFEAGCEEGDATSCYWAAVRHQTGLGGAIDKARAHELFVRACDGGYGTACYTLSLREPDPSRAAELLRLGCDGGSPDACEELRASRRGR